MGDEVMEDGGMENREQNEIYKTGDLLLEVNGVKVGDRVRLKGSVLSPEMVINRIPPGSPNTFVFECVWWKGNVEGEFQFVRLSPQVLQKIE